MVCKKIFPGIGEGCGHTEGHAAVALRQIENHRLYQLSFLDQLMGGFLPIPGDLPTPNITLDTIHSHKNTVGTHLLDGALDTLSDSVS